jgi:hypothetical protein
MLGQFLCCAQWLGLEIKDLCQQAINTVHGQVIVNACVELVEGSSSLHHGHDKS